MHFGCVCGAVLLAAVATYALAVRAGREFVSAASARRCEPLRVVDRHGLLLREVRASCRSTWTPLERIPALVGELVIAAEDRRFEQHAGVDPIAVARGVGENLRAGRIVSGASTITMQLVRLVRPELRARKFSAKLEQAWLALAIETQWSKPEILEAYLNLAYYGGGATGISDAADRWFGRPLAALSDGELALLAVLPRAPEAYHPQRKLAVALARRDQVLVRWALDHARACSPEPGARSPDQSPPARQAAIEAEPLAIAPARAHESSVAGHFVDLVVRELPALERQAGGTLWTTLDRSLQLQLERAVREHVATLAADGVEHAGAVVVETRSGAIRALVGSRDYAASQIDIVTRRRQLGSLLKPFVYALAIEAGEQPNSIALDVGDVPSEYRPTDWIGREAGPLTYREALGGSYNLAAVHVLERVGVAKLHARLKSAGVAELASPPLRYGLPLALGSARVRLLDVVAGYGFLVRDGSVRAAHGVERLSRASAEWQPAAAGESRVFSPEVSRQVAEMLSDPAARHRRFGRGLPIAAVVAKTGTASGLADVSAVLATPEYLIGAWAGRFDAAATSGMSGMWGAGPLAQRALELALRGRSPSATARPETRRQNPVALDATPELSAWVERARARGAASR